MPYTANEAGRPKFSKARCRVKNWREYDQTLRGSLTLWVTPEAIAAWQVPHTGRRGRARSYSDLAIEPGRLLGVSLAIPDHTTFSRHSQSLSLATTWTRNTEPVHVVIDFTGLKVYGAGEWQIVGPLLDQIQSLLLW